MIKGFLGKHELDFYIELGNFRLFSFLLDLF